MENNFQSCADCRTIELKNCKKFNNLFSKVFGYVLNSDRMACIGRIRETDPINFAAEMAEGKRHTIKRKQILPWLP